MPRLTHDHEGICGSPGAWVDSEMYYTRRAELAASRARSQCSAPMVIRDYAQPFLSMADGKTVITNRRQYREHLREHGCIEVGNEKLKPREWTPLPPVEADIAAAYDQLAAKGAQRRQRKRGKRRRPA